MAKTLKMIFTGSLFDAQHKKDSVEKKWANLLVVFLVKHLTGFLNFRVAD